MVMQASRQTLRSTGFPIGWLVVGFFVGVVHVAINAVLDASLAHGETRVAFTAFHRVFDATIPPVAGIVVGVLVAYKRQRDALIAAEHRASEALRERLKGVERQQIVWLLASSLLHDIRNPLHALGLLLDEISGLAPEGGSLATSINRAREQADHIEQRIASLREVAQSPPRVRTRVRVAAMVENVINDLQEFARAKDVTVKVDGLESCECRADERCLRTPLENLIVNAIDAAASRNRWGSVTVRIDRVGDCTRVLVSDTGPGIPDEIKDTLFEPLRSPKRQGLGLGLPLARALARLESGDVVLLRSAPPETVFALVLPECVS